MNIIKMILSITDKDKLQEYPYCINLKFTEDGEFKLKFNHNNAMNISDILKYNMMMDTWSKKGFRRLYIKDNQGNTPISTVLEKNDEIKIENKFFINLTSILKKTNEAVERAPAYISSDALTYIESIDLKSIRDENKELFLLDNLKEKLPKHVTAVKLFLINDENQYIVSAAHLGYLPYFLDMGEFQFKPGAGKEKKELSERFKNGDVDLRIEKYIFEVYPTDIYKDIKDMFNSNNKPLERIISHVLNNKGEKALGKVHINMSKRYTDYWHMEMQNIDIKVFICEDEVSKLNELNSLQNAKKFVEAISLMENFQNRSFITNENLAFAYCLSKDFNKSIELCESIIRENYKSIAHFTKGLALVMINEFDEAFISYMYGLHLIDKSIWYPEIKNNLLSEIEKNGIDKTDKIKKILDNIELYNISKVNNRHKRCFCGSNKKFRDCHERKLIEAIKFDSK